MHSCPRCNRTFGNFTKLVSHMGYEHRNVPHAVFMCGADGRAQTFQLFESYRRHLYRWHRELMGLDEEQGPEELDDNNVNSDNVSMTDLTEDNTDQQSDDNSNNTERPGDFFNDMKRKLCMFFFRVAEMHRIPHSVAETIFADFKIFVKETFCLFAAEVKQKVDTSMHQDLENLLSCSFLDDLFSSTDSKHQREKFAKQHLPYVRPQQHTLSDGAKFQYISIIDVLSNLMKSENFRSQLVEFGSQPESPSELRSFCDGLFYKERISELIPDGSQFTIFLVMYSDELEISNPLGAKRGVYKLFVVYFSVINIHARFRSQLSSIHVALIAKYADVQRNSIAATLEPLLQDIQQLSTDGINVVAGNTVISVMGFVAAFCGDNLSMNRLGGFNCCFSKGRPCRFCTISVPELRDVVHENDVRVRTLALHKSHIEGIQANPALRSTLYGVRERSPLMDLEYFDLTLQLPPDLMHDILEGAVRIVLREVLHGLISSGVLAYRDLDRVATFKYGRHDRHNKPEPLTKSFVEGKTNYRGTASQTWCLFHLFPLMFGDAVPEGDKFWSICLRLRRIVDLVFSECIPHDHLAYLQEEIRFLLSDFSTLFPGKMTSKMHFMVHYPRLISQLGPLRQYWCMRFEAKHQYLKSIANRNQNFRNICYSIAMRHQLLQSFVVANLDEDICMQTTKAKPVLNNDHLPQCSQGVFQADVPIWEVSSVTTNGCTYRIMDVVILAKDVLPKFGCISALYIYCGSVYLLVNSLDTLSFDEHCWCYNVSETADQSIITPSDLASYQVLDMYSGNTLVLRPEVMVQ